jgi:murein DD-endopeptidase MepM/ murein hydrolase activator NlpD
MARGRNSVLLVVLTTVLLAGCASGPQEGSVRRDASAGSYVRGDTGLPPTVTTGVARAATTQQRVRRFWVSDRRHYRSPWYAGAHRRMINFGCTPAPNYAPDPRCTRRRGFHHGLDIAMPCGTRLFSALRGRVVDPNSAGALGQAYGRNAFRIRNHRFRVDLVFGHTRRVYVRPGQRVRRGQLIARASDMGAPDGCHLHFEVRPRRGGYEDAVNPRERLRLRAID